MNLTIRFTDHKRIRLELCPDVSEKVGVRRSRRTVDFSFDNDLDTLLIETIDKLLKRNRITHRSLSKVRLGGEVDKTSSASTIVKAWMAAWEMVKKSA